MQREIIKLSDSQPTVVKLDFGPEGIERTGKMGKQYQYTLNDDSCVMWVAPAVRDAIMGSGAQAGDSISIQKYRGQFHVAVLGDAQEPPQPPRTSSEDRPPYHSPEPGPRAVERRAPRTRAVTAAPKPAEVIAEIRPHLLMMVAGSFRMAVDALEDAAQYAKEKGMTLQFNEEDVRTTANTIFIQVQKEGKR